MTELPHFTLPFQWSSSGGVLSAAVNEQESNAEIAACCEAIARTTQGQRTSLPEFGVPELEFNTSPEFARGALVTALTEFEPRVDSLVNAAPDDNDPEVQAIQAIIAPQAQEEGDAR